MNLLHSEQRLSFPVASVHKIRDSALTGVTHAP
jgi:hypothetical protein